MIRTAAETGSGWAAAIKEARPVDDPSALVPFGWAPGSYQGRCGRCNEMHSGSEKRSPVCQDCAEKARDRQSALAASEQVGTEAEGRSAPSTSDPAVIGLVEALNDLLSLPVAEGELRLLDRGIGTKTPNAAWLRARAALAKYATQQEGGGVVGSGPLSDLVLVKAPVRPTPAMIDAANEKSDARGHLRQGPEQVWRDMMTAWKDTQQPPVSTETKGEGGYETRMAFHPETGFGLVVERKAARVVTPIEGEGAK